MKQEKLNNKIFQVLRYIIKRENFPKNTVTFFREIDCSVIEKIRFNYGLHHHKKPSYTAFIIKAVSHAIAEHPYVNARVFPSFPYAKIFKFPDIHTAVACEKDTPGAEIMTFIDIFRHTNLKTIDQINRELIQLANSNVENNPQLKDFMNIIKNYPIFIARQLCTLPSIFPSLWMKYRGSAMLISSPSKYGVDAVTATWAHPIGISFGLVQKKAIVKNNKIEAVPCFTLTMNWDRRLMAGAPAARFFNTFATNLMNQEFLESHLEEDLNLEASDEKIIAMA